MQDEKLKPEANEGAESKPKTLTGKHDVEIGGVVVIRRGEKVSAEELESRVTQAAVEHFEKRKSGE